MVNLKVSQYGHSALSDERPLMLPEHTPKRHMRLKILYDIKCPNRAVDENTCDVINATHQLYAKNVTHHSNRVIKHSAFLCSP